MDIEGTYNFQTAPIEQVWNMLLDPEVLARAIPGCERLEAVGEDTYEATMNVGISAVKGIYTGRVTISDKQPPHHCRITVEGSGTRGFIKGGGTLDLSEGNDRTIANYKGSAQLGGTIAGVGMQMVGGTAKLIINQFFGALTNELHQQATLAQASASTAQKQADAKNRHERITMPPSKTTSGPVVQIVRRLRVSDGSPQDEQRWARRLVLSGAGLLVSLYAFVGFLTWLINRNSHCL